jgi:hypothetical protein
MRSYKTNGTADLRLQQGDITGTFSIFIGSVVSCMKGLKRRTISFYGACLPFNDHFKQPELNTHAQCTRLI